MILSCHENQQDSEQQIIIILGLSGQALSAFVESKIAETKEIERLTSGAWRLKTNSAWVPTGELVMKPGEKFETELPGMNKQIYLHIVLLMWNN